MLRQRQRLVRSTNALYTRQFSQNVTLRNSSPAAAAAANAGEDARNDDLPLKDRFIALKANIVVKTSTAPSATAASRTLSNHYSPYHATVTELLIAHGANILPNANMDEFGMGSHSQNSWLGPVKSRFRRDGMALSPGGSSGGSAVLVEGGLVWGAVGTDTGGSVRLPAAWNGVCGFKPSYGRVSRWGVIQYANSLDTVGVLSKGVAGCKTMFGLLDRFDERDPTSLPERVRNRFTTNERKQEGRLRIGIPLEYNISSLSAAVKSTYTSLLNTLQDAGHTLIPVSLPSTKSALSAYYILAPAEASSNLAKYDGIRYGHRTSPGPDASPNADPALPLYAQTRSESFGDEVKRRILLGAYTLSSEAMDNYFIQAQKIRRLVQRDFDRVFSTPNPLLDHHEHFPGEESNEVDFLLTPTAPTLPPTIQDLSQQTPVESYMNDVFTVPASLAGLPAISIPVPLSKDVRKEMDEEDIKSSGMQLIGQFGDDEEVLAAAEEVERLVRCDT
ncbi:A subunit of glutamyl-tRNA amidotransferase [Lecanosticta acicola]|uniref:Glutamyl-tRNA(Gln) amidotransferase subunit A, mitochondrial n=1 Tax=Lecanosticta acicola TaxID=111012 RepID=A0AAI8YSA9_9PEZI|nr:A subunit of glutamyl-tRNA amidotransferase [Lecanosticta acicola]